MEARVVRSTDRVGLPQLTVEQVVRVHLEHVLLLQLPVELARIPRVAQILSENTDVLEVPVVLNTDHAAPTLTTVEPAVKAHSALALLLQDSLVQIQRVALIRQGSIPALEVRVVRNTAPAEQLQLTVEQVVRVHLEHVLLLQLPVESARIPHVVQIRLGNTGAQEVLVAHNTDHAEPTLTTAEPAVRVHLVLATVSLHPLPRRPLLLHHQLPLVASVQITRVALLRLADTSVQELRAALSTGIVEQRASIVALAARLRSGLATVPRHHHRRPLLFLYHHQLLQVRRILPSTLRWPQPFRPGVLQMGISH